MLAASLAFADGLPGPVGEYGGRALTERAVLVLDVAAPALRRIDRATLSTTQTRLSGADAALDPYGLAAPGDGTFWVLADRGRVLLRFSDATGERVEKRRLGQPCQGIATLWKRTGFVALSLRPNERLLLEAENGGLHPFAAVVSRSAADVTAHLVRNLFRCGSGSGDEIPCWFLADPPEVLLVRRSGNVRRIVVPTFATARSSGPAGSEPGAAFTYPVRDVFLAGDRLWILSNQEGEKTPIEEGAARSRHVVLLRPGRPNRIVPLAREARAILDASERSVTLLYSDGWIDRVAVP